VKARLRVTVSVAAFAQLSRKAEGASAHKVWRSLARLAGGAVEAGRLEARRGLLAAQRTRKALGTHAKTRALQKTHTQILL
jgi:hypothetical protein